MEFAFLLCYNENGTKLRDFTGRGGLSMDLSGFLGLFGGVALFLYGICLMPGDPLRAKFIAENFLEEAQLVTSVRGMNGYTGKYKGFHK